MRTYALVGTGSRGTAAYLKPMHDELSDCTKLVAVCDTNPLRAKGALEYYNLEAPVYTDFDKLLKETKPDLVVVTSVDATHHDYIIRALDAGCDVVSEKPMTTDGEKCNAIIAAERRSGKKVSVTFNCRFIPLFVRTKELLMEGAVGDIYSVHFEWMLDTSHGADYFRRWHRRRENSGSLLIHKSTHHFDLINWLIDDVPTKVNAFGERRFYTPDHQPHGERCCTCTYKNSCEYAWDIESSDFYKKIYKDAEGADGYHRDACIFSDEIDIEDTLALSVKYKKGAVLSYALTAHSPYEGMKFAINGSLGRMEVEWLRSGIYADEVQKNIRIYNRKKEEISYKFPSKPVFGANMPGVDQLTKDNMGGHDGADPLLRAAIFRGFAQDPLGQLADTYAGAMSLGIGAAANISLKEDRAVSLSEIFDFIRE